MGPVITNIERHHLDVPLRSVPGQNLRRQNPGWSHVEVLECELADGSVGYGETMLTYTWGTTSSDAIDRAIGEDAIELIHTSSTPPGLEMALLDAVGRSLDVPVHELLGGRVRDSVPIAWWCYNMPAADVVEEATTALSKGYESMKMKGRPWFDIWEQIDALEEHLPDDFHVTIDFNGTMRNADRALPLLGELAASPIVEGFEDPIPRRDVEGNKRLRENLDVPLVNHYGAVDPTIAIQTDMFDVALLDVSGPTDVLSDAAVAAVANWPGCIQIAGTGISVAMAIQLGGVLDCATYPLVGVHQIYEHSLLSEEITVGSGVVPLPDAPGLGVSVDRDAINSFEVGADRQPPRPERLLEMSWPNGLWIYCAADEMNVMAYAQQPDTRIPYFESGATTRRVPNDGSATWQNVYEQSYPDPLVVEPGDTAPFDEE
jgi:L-alanine-DL-glutamate epimerase-like enolase superfamily enzyme